LPAVGFQLFEDIDIDFIGVHRRQMSFNDLRCAEYVYLRLSAFICG